MTQLSVRFVPLPVAGIWVNVCMCVELMSLNRTNVGDSQVLCRQIRDGTADAHLTSHRIVSDTVE